MIRYLFTNDLRISMLNSSIKNAAKLIKADKVPSASEDKSINNNTNTLAFYFNLKKGNRCTAVAVDGNIRKVVLNFIKKFQFPNPRTKESYDNAVTDNLSFAPMRTIVKLLYICFINDGNEAYLTRSEIEEFLFFNSAVVTEKVPDLMLLYLQIKEYRKTQSKPSTIVPSAEREWKHSDRQLREMTKILEWTGCIAEDNVGRLFIKQTALSEQEKADLYTILTCNSYWDPSKEEYSEYMDLDDNIDELIGEASKEREFEEDTIKMIKGEAAKIAAVDNEAGELYAEFRSKFGPEVLKELSGLDLLHRMFINETDKKDSLCNVLEYDSRFSMFGSIAGGTAYKHGLFYSWQNQSWMAGSGRKSVKLSEKEAIELGIKMRDELLAGVNIIESFGDLAEVKDYANLQAKLYSAMPNTIGKAWVKKYFHMIFPDIFPVIYNEEKQRKALNAVNIEADDNSFIRMGQIALFVKKCGISNVAFSKVLQNIESKGNIEIEEFPTEMPYEYKATVVTAFNKVVYGTPGCGKSYFVEYKLLPQLGVSVENRIRTTFYQDYTNTDFVGQIIPKIKEDKSVTYEFNPGPFALALKRAIAHPDEPVALIIEELNRGNAPSIFGDIFQLLDRDKTQKSQYKIVNVNLQSYLNNVFKEQKYYFDYIVIPSNLYLVATMNTSDQNVFTLDTAFKRRWKFEKLQNVFTADHKYAGFYVPGIPTYTWEKFVNAINKYIVSRADEVSSEDKQLGIYFVGEESLCRTPEEAQDPIKKREFAYKLLEYLWDDVAKFARSEWFNPDIKTLDQLIKEYVNNGEKVFIDGIL